MMYNRRQFIAALGIGAGAACVAPLAGASEQAADNNPDAVGVLVDTTECIGCRKCEFACAKANNLTELPLESYEDPSVFISQRRMKADAYTVVNKYDNPADTGKPIFVKAQCMHCLKPSCASACIVGAMKKQANGSVTYDPWKCIGCRYCMIACPFQVPAYEYDNALTPKVSKCSLCFERVTKENRMPACVENCPPMCLTFAKREKLLELAREKMAATPERYNPHIYGENEVGGTSWLYLAGRPMKELGMLDLGEKAPPALTESVQHSVFKFGVPPLLLYGLLGTAMKVFGKEDEKANDEREES